MSTSPSSAPWLLFRRWQWWAAGGVLVLVPAITTRFWLAGDSGWARATLMVALDLLPWVVALPIPLWLAWKFPLTNGRRGSHSAIHVAACIACAAVLPLAALGAARLLGANVPGAGGGRGFGSGPVPANGSGSPPPGGTMRMWRETPEGPVEVFNVRRRPPSMGPSIWHLLLFRAPLNVAIYALVLAIAHNWQAAQREREREQRAAELERRLAEARLTSLTRQLQPHFLFNTLNAIASLVRRSPEQAENMVIDLSELLRRTLDAGERHTVTLAEELALLDLYVDLQRGRFGTRVRSERRIDPEVLAARVPALLLQPLVENSFRHGVEGTDTDVTLTIEAQRVGDRVQLAVIDDAPRSTVSRRSTGLGLANTRSRLTALHGAELNFSAQPGRERGFAVRCAFPFQPALQLSPNAT